MNPFPILIHTHFHNRRTGVTRSIENVMPYFKAGYDAYIFGYGIEGRKISFIRILKLVLRKRYFVLHCHRNNEVFFMLFFRLIGGNFKLIFTRHADTPPSKPTKYLMKKSDLVIALTNNMVNTIPVPTVVVEHGVNVDVFKPGKPVYPPAIKQHKIIACIGRVRESKGQKALLEVLAPILKQFPDWALAIIGKVDKRVFKKELGQVISYHEVSEQVYFIDETPDIISYYKASHSVIVPSFTEGFSLVCAEAMSCGCNVLATKGVGVHSKLITSGVNGYLFDVGDREALRKLLIKLCNGGLPHLGNEARGEIVDKWSSKKEAKELISTYIAISPE